LTDFELAPSPAEAASRFSRHGQLLRQLHSRRVLRRHLVRSCEERMAKPLDKIDVIEAAYRLDEVDETAWIGQLGKAFSLASGLETSAAFTYELVDGKMKLRATWDERLRGILDLKAAHEDLTAAQLEDMYGRALMASLMRDRLAEIGLPFEETAAAAVAAEVGGHDIFGLPGVDLDGHGVAISGVIGRKRPSAHEMHSWSCVAAHIACAHRLRRALARAPAIDRAAAIFKADGELEHAADEVAIGARERLRHAVRRIERARCSGVDEDEAFSLWKGLVDGRWSVVDHFLGGGRRYYVVIHNPPEARPIRGLSDDERTALGYVIGGTSNKVASFALGQSETAYSRTMKRAMSKLGVASRASLIELASRLGAPGGGAPDDVDLHTLDLGGVQVPVISAPSISCPENFTDAERDLAAMIAEPMSNAEIAEARRTSPRTVANQLAAMYRKCGVSTREELIVALLERRAP
jgi:DNA-binding NarL/FixJ family response regulator